MSIIGTKQAAKILGVSRYAVYRLERSGELDTERRGCMGVPHAFDAKHVRNIKKIRAQNAKHVSANSVSGVASRIGLATKTVRKHIKKTGVLLSNQFFGVVCGRLVIDSGTQDRVAAQTGRRLAKRLPKKAKNAVS